jgi:hypothetical protein
MELRTVCLLGYFFTSPKKTLHDNAILAAATRRPAL